MNEHDRPDPSAPLPPEALARIDRVQRLALISAATGIIVLAVGALLNLEQFFRSYLVAYMFVIGIVLGSLAIVMVHHVSGGAWGLVIRRLLESATGTLPIMALLFIPLAAGITYLYPWARAEDVAQHAALEHKRPYLNIPFFLVRAAIYFTLWTLLARTLNKWSREQDVRPPVPDDRRFRLLSAPGLLVYGLTVTFASIDWVMSLEPEWFSTIFGILFMGGQALSAMAFAIAVLYMLSKYRPLAGVVAPGHFHDLGKLLFAFVMLWAYFSFSQFLIVWSANLPEEIPWYLRRTNGVWHPVILLIVAGHFVLPFLVLLSRDVKRDARLLTRVALALVAMRFVDLTWLIAPSFEHAAANMAWMYPAALAAIGGVWVWSFAGQLRDKPLLPFNDPYIGDAFQHETH